MPQTPLEWALVAAAISGVALMVVGALTDLPIMIGIALCGLSAALLVVREQSSNDTPDSTDETAA